MQMEGSGLGGMLALGWWLRHMDIKTGSLSSGPR